MCYRTINGIVGSCESLCLLSEFFFLEKNSKVKFLIFFYCVVSFVVGLLWIVVGCCGSFRVLVTTSHAFVHRWKIIHKKHSHYVVSHTT